MAAATEDDELLAILLVNLRNAEATFGAGTPPYESIRSTVKEHLDSMKAKGLQTNLTSVRREDVMDPGTMPMTLAFRPKSGTSRS